MPSVKLGNEVLFERMGDLIKGERAGLITNPSGVTSDLRSTADLLHEAPDVRLVALFGPEHGIRGDVADGAAIPSSVDAVTGVPVYSLYGSTRKPTEEMLEHVDVLLFDIQDVGVRFYTYLYTMAYAMEVCGDLDIPFLVLDRPNPLGGDVMEGNVLDPKFRSFVGNYPIPLRYGMTIGELARLLNEEYALGADLRVVPMEGWRRDMLFDDTGLPWVPPSPNIPSFATAIVYPGTCLFEGTNVSEGRGTTAPFLQIGAPYVDGRRLAEVLADRELPGVLFRPLFFTPRFGKHEGHLCGGVYVHVVDPDAFEPVWTGLEMVAALRALPPAHFEWRPHFDLLMGTDAVRRAIEDDIPVEEIVAGWRVEREAFGRTGAKYRMYK